MRQTRPGETLSATCGHHCGIRATAEGGAGYANIGHCRCPECGCELPDKLVQLGIAGVPMCYRWGAGLDRRLASGL